MLKYLICSALTFNAAYAANDMPCIDVIPTSFQTLMTPSIKNESTLLRSSLHRA